MSEDRTRPVHHSTGAHTRRETHCAIPNDCNISRDSRNTLCYIRGHVIKTFIHKGLRELYETGTTAQIPPVLVGRCKVRLAALDQALSLSDLNLPGFNFHPLKGRNPVRYSIHVNGPWALTFEWRAPDVFRLDLEQYH